MLAIRLVFRKPPTPDKFEDPAKMTYPTHSLVRSLRHVLPLLVAASLANGAEPTEVRSWSSTAGTSIEASATAFSNGVVTLETTTGRLLKVNASKLSAADRELLDGHFAGAASTGGGEPADLEHPLGETVGPIEADGSHYFLYLPKSLKKGRKAPLLFFTCSGGGDAGRLNPMIEGAELCGWIIAISQESKNGMEREVSVVHSKNCVDHIKETLPVDEERVYFSGNSGGAREAYFNSSKIKSAGVLGLIAGAKPDEISRKMDYFFISGARDYNRCGTSFSYGAAKSSAAIRFHPGGHGDGPGWLMTEGMVWLQTRCIEKGKKEVSDAERLDFETATLDWAEAMKDSEPYRAAWWVDRIIEAGLTPASKSRAEALGKELGSGSEAAAYSKGLAALENFAARELADGPRYAPDCFEHTSSSIQKKVEKLEASYGATPWVKDILAAMKEKTDRG